MGFLTRMGDSIVWLLFMHSSEVPHYISYNYINKDPVPLLIDYIITHSLSTLLYYN